MMQKSWRRCDKHRDWIFNLKKNVSLSPSPSPSSPPSLSFPPPLPLHSLYLPPHLSVLITLSVQIHCSPSFSSSQQEGVNHDQAMILANWGAAIPMPGIPSAPRRNSVEYRAQFRREHGSMDMSFVPQISGGSLVHASAGRAGAGAGRGGGGGSPGQLQFSPSPSQLSVVGRHSPLPPGSLASSFVQGSRGSSPTMQQQLLHHR